MPEILYNFWRNVNKKDNDKVNKKLIKKRTIKWKIVGFIIRQERHECQKRLDNHFIGVIKRFSQPF